MTHTSPPPALPPELTEPVQRRPAPSTPVERPPINNFTPREVYTYLTRDRDNYIFRNVPHVKGKHYPALAFWEGTHFTAPPREESIERYTAIIREAAQKILDSPDDDYFTTTSRKNARTILTSQLRANSCHKMAAESSPQAPDPIERTAYIAEKNNISYTNFADLSNLHTKIPVDLYALVLPYLTDPLDTLTPHLHADSPENIRALTENLPEFFYTFANVNTLLQSSWELLNANAAPYATHRIIVLPEEESIVRRTKFIRSFLDSNGFNATVSKEHTQQERYTPHSLILTYNA